MLPVRALRRAFTRRPGSGDVCLEEIYPSKAQIIISAHTIAMTAMTKLRIPLDMPSWCNEDSLMEEGSRVDAIWR